MASACCFAPDDTPDGELPPWEIAKAHAFKVALYKVAETLEKLASKLLGQPVVEFIASQIIKQGGDARTVRNVQKVLARCRDPTWYP